MSDFKVAFQKVLDHEGTAFTNIKEDKGGATKFGITRATLEDFRDKPVTDEDVKALTLEEAEKVYKVMFWNQMNLDNVKDQDVAEILFDQGVNRGTGTVTKQVQKALNLMRNGTEETIALTTNFGPLTTKRINQEDPKKFLWNFFKMSQASYLEIVKSNPEQLKFISGWVNRTYSIIDQYFE